MTRNQQIQTVRNAIDKLIVTLDRADFVLVDWAAGDIPPRSDVWLSRTQADIAKAYLHMSAAMKELENDEG